MADAAAPTPSIVDHFVVPKCDDLIEILYQDDDILLINKPGGLLSLSGKNVLNCDSVHYRLVYGQKGATPAFPTAKLPHRLDFGTSGIMVVGLNAEAIHQLNRQFQNRTVRKRYTAMLEGWVTADHGQIAAAIAKDKKHFPRVRVCSVAGQPTVTEYQVLQRLEQPLRSLVQFTPQTGRTHQLRVHSQFIGHPILGCDLYNSDSSEALADRLLLHATDLHFEHPVSGLQTHGECPCPFS